MPRDCKERGRRHKHKHIIQSTYVKKFMESSSLRSFIHYVLYYAPLYSEPPAMHATYSLNIKSSPHPSIHPSIHASHLTTPLLPDIGEQILARRAKTSYWLWCIVRCLRNRRRGRCAAPATKLLVRADLWRAARLRKPITTRHNTLARQRRPRTPSKIISRSLCRPRLSRAPRIIGAHSVEVAPSA